MTFTGTYPLITARDSVSSSQNTTSRLVTLLAVCLTAGSASPSIDLGGLRLIPIQIASTIGFLVVALSVLVKDRVRLDPYLLSIVALLTSSAVASQFGAVNSDLPPNWTKLFIFFYQFVLAIASYALAARIDLKVISFGAAIWGGIFGILLALQSAGLIAGANQVAIAGSTFQRAQLFFGQPNSSAAYLLAMLPLSFLGGQARSVHIFLLWILRTLMVLGVVATFSRSAMAAVIGSYIALLLIRSSRWGNYGLSLLILSLALAFFGSLSESIYGLIDFIIAGDGVLEGDFSAIERFGLGQAGIKMFYDQPILGVGVGNYPAALGIFDSTLDATLGMPHNVVIHFAAEQGLFGLLALATFISFLIRHLNCPTPSFPLLWAAWTILINSWFGWPFFHGVGESLMVICGLLAYYARRHIV